MHWKFRARSGLTKMGLWERVDRYRLRRRFRRGFMHEPDFQFFRRFEGSRGLFLDVGANIGQSALSFRVANSTCSILSFEPNPDMEYGLREVKRLLGAGFDFRMVGLGAVSTTMSLHVPYVRGVPFTQFATFHRDGLEDNPDLRRRFLELAGTERFTIVAKSIELVRCDDLNLKPEFMKIDVEGGEFDVLQGAEETLARCRPIVMTEGNAVRRFLEDRDYAMCVYRPEYNSITPATDGDVSLNYFFIPTEKMSRLMPTNTTGPR
jgi:FkbM family methyltransferase